MVGRQVGGDATLAGVAAPDGHCRINPPENTCPEAPSHNIVCKECSRCQVVVPTRHAQTAIAPIAANYSDKNLRPLCIQSKKGHSCMHAATTEQAATESSSSAAAATESTGIT